MKFAKNLMLPAFVISFVPLILTSGKEYYPPMLEFDVDFQTIGTWYVWVFG